jgi:PQQ-like domain
VTRRDLLRVSMATAAWKLSSGHYPRAWAAESPADQVRGAEWRKVFDAETSGLEYYSQGGVVVDGVVYFSANDNSRRLGFRGLDASGFPCVEAFRADNYKIIRRYPIAETYDSTPLVIQKRDGNWLVVAHEYKKSHTVAVARDTGEVQWTSDANQHGSLFFGYSYFQRGDGSKLIFMACENGLHALSVESGQEVWWIRQEVRFGGVTPCVDQANGWVYYQASGKVLKIHAEDGKIIKAIDVPHPSELYSWNTVLVNDSYGYFVATNWVGDMFWDSAVRVYDRDLKLVWERTHLPFGYKGTLTYADGKLVTGSGNIGSRRYVGSDWKYIPAYAIGDGRFLWKCDLRDYDYATIMNVPYFNGSFYAETQDSPPMNSKLFRIRACDGVLSEVINYQRPITSCAQCIIAHGKVFSGDLWEDRIVVTKIAENSKADWPGPFGDPQTNPMALPDEPGARNVPMQELERPAGQNWQSTGILT